MNINEITENEILMIQSYYSDTLSMNETMSEFWLTFDQFHNIFNRFVSFTFDDPATGITYRICDNCWLGKKVHEHFTIDTTGKHCDLCHNTLIQVQKMDNIYNNRMDRLDNLLLDKKLREIKAQLWGYTTTPNQ